MRILLLAPIHREKEFLKQKGKYPFLKGQGQQSWVEALEELGHKVFVFKYTDSILIPNFVRIYLQDFLEKKIAAWYGRLRRFIENYYFISFENIFKNWKLLTIAKNAKPNLIIISGGVTPIFPQTIKTIKNDFNCKVLLFSGVNPVWFYASSFCAVGAGADGTRGRWHWRRRGARTLPSAGGRRSRFAGGDGGCGLRAPASSGRLAREKPSPGESRPPRGHDRYLGERALS